MRLAPVIGSGRVAVLLETAARTRERLEGRRIVNVNSTATGGGVAELLYVLLGYARGAGIATEWLVIQASPAFFATTKRIHNWLYGAPGDGGDLDSSARRAYERTIAANAERVLAAVRPGDVAVVHDPQPAGLVPLLVERGVHVVWRCHVGIDRRNEWTERAWDFLRRYVEPAHAHVFSRRAFAPKFVTKKTLAVIAPSIDPFATKNAKLPRAHVTGVLADAGLVVPATGTRPRGGVRRADVVREGDAPGLNTPLVVQVSRWDRLKDMRGVLEGFTKHVPSSTGAQLVLAGPAFAGVADDPEAEAVWQETTDVWRGLSARDRARVHLALIPMEDPEENALVINALQRHAAIVVQKSLAEGFGLTVAEAMWKSRAVVGSAVGGIADQILDGVSGALVQDPHDLPAFGRALTRLLRDPDERRRLGRNAHRRVSAHFLPDRHLLDYARLVEQVVGRS
jgi:trehalose synthase